MKGAKRKNGKSSGGRGGRGGRELKTSCASPLQGKAVALCSTTSCRTKFWKDISRGRGLVVLLRELKLNAMTFFVFKPNLNEVL